jgi:hypothetical protein
MIFISKYFFVAFIYLVVAVAEVVAEVEVEVEAVELDNTISVVAEESAVVEAVAEVVVEELDHMKVEAVVQVEAEELDYKMAVEHNYSDYYLFKLLKLKLKFDDLNKKKKQLKQKHNFYSSYIYV